MKNLKIKIILSLAIFVGMFGLVNLASAATSYLSVAPTDQNKTAGSIFSTSIKMNNSGNKVCTVEGTLMLNNLTCQSITIPDDLQSLVTPTCSKPNFNLGIPNCVMTDKLIMTVSAKTGSVGPASISANNVDMLGVYDGDGEDMTSVGSSLVPANYTVIAPVVATVKAPAVVVATVAPKKVTETVVTKTVTTVTETNQNLAVASTTLATTTDLNLATATTTTSENSLLASVGQINSALMGSRLFSYILGILSTILIYEIYVFIKRKKNNLVK